MNQDYVTQLRLQLREAALREERRTPLAQRVVRARRGLPGPAPLAAALAIALFALAAAIGVMQLRRDPEPVKPKVIQTFHVADNLGSLSSGFGAAWLSDPVTGYVLRVDPKTRKVTARIDVAPPVGGEGAPAIPAPGEVQAVAGPDAVWALTGDLLTSGSEGAVVLARIDPDTNRVVARIPVRAPGGGNFGPLFVQSDDAHLWVIGAQGALRIDPKRNAPDRFVSYQLGGHTIAEGDRVWTLTTADHLREIDARTGRTVSDVPLDESANAHLMPGPPGFLTLAGPTTLSLLDHDGTILWRARLGAVVQGCVFDGDHLWVAVASPPDDPDRPTHLVRLDPETGRRTGQLRIPAADGAGATRVGDELWIADSGGDVTVVR
jgi:hypothetical protein